MSNFIEQILPTLPDGVLVEIGCGFGLTTEILAKSGRRVIAIDPFDNYAMPDSYGKPYPYERFKGVLDSYPNIEHWRFNSLNEEAEKLKDETIALAFVDGLQFKRAVLADLDLVSHAHIIIVDDMNRQTGISEVPQAVKEFRAKTGRQIEIINNRYGILK